MLQLPISVVDAAKDVVSRLALQGVRAGVQLQSGGSGWAVVISARLLQNDDWIELVLNATEVTGGAVSLEASLVDADGSEHAYLGSKVVSRGDLATESMGFIDQASEPLGLRRDVAVAIDDWSVALTTTLAFAGEPRMTATTGRLPVVQILPLDEIVVPVKMRIDRYFVPKVADVSADPIEGLWPAGLDWVEMPAH